MANYETPPFNGVTAIVVPASCLILKLSRNIGPPYTFEKRRDPICRIARFYFYFRTCCRSNNVILRESIHKDTSYMEKIFSPLLVFVSLDDSLVSFVFDLCPAALTPIGWMSENTLVQELLANEDNNFGTGVFVDEGELSDSFLNEIESSDGENDDDDLLITGTTTLMLTRIMTQETPMKLM
ncbi:hypothetical protein J6590_045148 [Homalodisca vitripennis]|nr:hypothetical protein J6590_045148 [Homalodisca vitripennis]